jgi:hypothetical protein
LIGKVPLGRLPLWVCLFFGISSCGRMDAILYDPPMTPAQMLDSMPFVETSLFSCRIILMEPRSTFFVYLLGLLTIGCGIYFLRNREGHISRFWWGLALIFWGLGALFAGTSYQIFSYELKCAGREFCLWTNWWEVFYLIFSVASLNAMVMAQANACTGGRLRNVLIRYALMNMLIYTGIALAGALLPNKFMISFELMILFLAPTILLFIVLNTRRYIGEKNSMDLSLVKTWLGLCLIVAVYFIYLLMGFTESLWNMGFWFSANDVLHIMLIVWMLYIVKVVAPRIIDLPEA